MKREITLEHGHSPAETRKSSMHSPAPRRYPIGAEVTGANETHFRLWAPKAKQIDLVIEAAGGPCFHPLAREADGYFSGAGPVGAGALYRFRVDGAEKFFPDPASRFQPQGPHQASQVVDPATFKWSDSSWPGVKLKGQIIYEMHIGTFTTEGTWRAAAEQLEELARVGITVVEVMPIADFPGNFGWGYDGVDFFAPTRLYGSPDDFRYFVDRAHAARVAVILDVVYNHFGPDGNYLGIYSDDYLQHGSTNDWGDSINFDGPNSTSVREFFVTNARYWIDEFHLDGFRFDATESIFDNSEEHILAVISQAARAAAGGRSIIMVAENERQNVKLVRPRGEGGYGLDGVWNDDLHHSAFVALTGRREAYCTDYPGAPQEFISGAKYGYLFQGQPYSWQEAPRGSDARGLPPEAFVVFIENHDQVANGTTGQRLRLESSPGRYRAMTALLLLGPWTPMLFQGQEFGSYQPFVYFSDVGDGNLRDAIRKGRFEFLSQFPSLADPDARKELPVPSDPTTFERCKLNFAERKTNKPIYDLHIDLMKLRREDARFSRQEMNGVDGAVLGPKSFVLRYFGSENDDRLLLINFGEKQSLEPMPEPLLAAPAGFEWTTLWSSEAAKYGGRGVAPLPTQDPWTLPAESAIALKLIPETGPRRLPKKRG